MNLKKITIELFSAKMILGLELGYTKKRIQKEEDMVFKYHIAKDAIKGNFTGAFKQIAPDSTLAEIMLGKKVGDSFNFGGVRYVILEVV